jgi:MarR family transcriptional regulator for hemolysin
MSISAQHRLLLHRAMAKADVHPGQAMMLRVIAAHAGHCPQSSLGEALGVSRPNVTRILQRMERGGLVSRHTNESDQRHSHVVLTAAGRAVVERMETALQAHITTTVSGLAVKDLNALAQGLRAWNAILEEALP